MKAFRQVVFDRETLPVLAEGDLLVVGGSFGGVAAALAAADAGRTVILVEPRTYLGREVTACLRPWLDPAGDKPMPELLRSCIEAAGILFPEEGLVAFRMAELKTHLEDRLLSAGVKLLYASLPVGWVIEDDHIVGVVIGNKSGRQVLRAVTVVDATETGLLCRLAEGLTAAMPSERKIAQEETAIFLRTLEFDKVGAVQPGWLAVPEDLGLVENKVRLVPGSRGEGHWLVECLLRLPAYRNSAFELTAREIAARRQTMALAAHLRKRTPGFEKAYLAHASQLLAELLEDGSAGAGVSAGHVDAVVLPVGNGLPGLALSRLSGPVPGLFRLQDHFVHYSHSERNLLRNGTAIGEALGRWLGHASAQWGAVKLCTEPAPLRLADVQVREPESPQRGRVYQCQRVAPLTAPLARTVDVLVIGGGTSGATAAFAAAAAGASTLLVEAGPGLGGTGTVGGVHSYWFGRRVGFSRQIIEAVEVIHTQLGLESPEGELLKWNIEAKMHALLLRALDAGAEVLWGAVATGALVEGQQVRGVVVATPLGPLALGAKVVIDATGDGDVAFFAGAQTVYGAARDHVTMWYSLAQFYRPGVTQNNFTSMVDVGNVEDYTRAILAGRRRVKGHDAGTYVAPRESRHVLADVVLTLNDQLLKRCWPDTIYVAFSNHDVKGHSSSDWLRIGLIPPNLEVEIPYRALLPKGLEGILVTGKAFSATHDALPAVRMQPDLENLGGVAGAAAVLAVQSGCSPRQVDVGALQETMVAAGVLPEHILHRSLVPVAAGQPELAELVAQLDSAKPLYAYQDMELDAIFADRIPFVDLVCAGPQAIPVLQAAMKTSQGARQLLLAKALAMVGAKSAVPELIAAIHQETPDEGLQSRKAHIRHVQMPPDQGAMPEAANLLYALGMTRDERALPIWDHFSALIVDTDDADFRNRNLGLFYYVDALCYGMERLGDSRAVPFLKRMHANPIFHYRYTTEGFEPDFFLERQAYLELVISRSLARCGDREGFETLIAYLADSRALLAEHAHSELKAISGEDFGKESGAWLAWLSSTDQWRTPHPVIDLTDPISAWEEEILISG